MIRNFIVPLLFIFGLQFVFADFALAGFGITPPYVQNSSLTRNSIYEQQILLVRSDPRVDLQATVSVDAPEIDAWIEVVEGSSFLLPRGEQKVPMTVRVTVPSDADFKNYTGKIRIKTGTPEGNVAEGSVSISLGAQVDINLNVIDKVIEDFRVRKIDISDFNEGHKLGWLFFPGKIKFKMLIENTGNVDVAPSLVRFRIFDPTGAVLLEETDHTNRITKVPPFGTEEITAELPSRLPAGSYLARFEIYNGDDLKHEGEFSLSVLPYGTLQSAGYGFFGLSLPHKISVILPVLTILLIAGSLLYSSRRRKSVKIEN